jgi:hypothetical protein
LVEEEAGAVALHPLVEEEAGEAVALHPALALALVLVLVLALALALALARWGDALPMQQPWQPLCASQPPPARLCAGHPARLSPLHGLHALHRAWLHALRVFAPV